MGLKERLFDRYFSDIAERRVEERTAAIEQQRLQEARGRTQEDFGWRRLTDSERDLSPIAQDRMREIAVYLWTYNPLAHRIINALVEWVVGEGIQIQADEDVTRDYLMKFWRDAGNRWDLRLEERVRELWLMGEQFWPSFTNEYTGIMRLGVLDPARVKTVVMDPDNALIAIGIITKEAHGRPERRMRTILSAEEHELISPAAIAERERFTEGELFAFAVNKLSTQSRGVSELFALADWLDGYEQLLFAQLAQERARSNYLFDVTLEGATQEEIDKRARESVPPKPFSVRYHNEKEAWNVIGAPPGAGAHSDVVARLFRNHTLGGAAIPEHWFGGGGDVNRATAAEMGGPTEKAFTAKQRTVKHIITDVLSVQVERGIAAGALPDNEEVRQFEVVFPDLSSRDTSRTAAALQQVASGLALAKREGWVDNETSSRVLASMIHGFGIDVDAQEMLDRGQKELSNTLMDEAARLMGRERVAPEDGEGEAE